MIFEDSFLKVELLFEDILFSPLFPISIIDFIKDIGKREKEGLENFYNLLIPYFNNNTINFSIEFKFFPYSVATQESLRRKKDKNIIINIFGDILCLYSLENKILKKVFIYLLLKFYDFKTKNTSKTSYDGTNIYF